MGKALISVLLLFAWTMACLLFVDQFYKFILALLGFYLMFSLLEERRDC